MGQRGQTGLLIILAAGLGVIVAALALGGLLVMALGGGNGPLLFAAIFACIGALGLGWRVLRDGMSRSDVAPEAARDRRQAARLARAFRVLPWVLADMIATSAALGAGAAELIVRRNVLPGVGFLVGAIILTLPTLLLVALVGGLPTRPAGDTAGRGRS